MNNERSGQSVMGNSGSLESMPPSVIIENGGELRWSYEMNMWKNPVIVIVLWKILLLAAMIPALLVFSLDVLEGKALLTAFFSLLKVGGLAAALLSCLALLAYPVVALLHGGRYCVIFEMNDAGVKHIQLQRQFEKSQVLAAITVLAGAAGGNPQVAGAGILAGVRKSLYTRFKNVKKVVVHEKRNTLYLNENLTRNQVYADASTFPFVRDYILSHTPKARVKYKS